MDAFLDGLEREQVRGAEAFRFNQLDYLTDEAGLWQVDWLGRFEHLETDCKTLAARLQIPFASLPRCNGSVSATESGNDYTVATRERVAVLCARDIAALGYVWGEAQAGPWPVCRGQEPGPGAV